MRHRATIVQNETGRPVQFKITEQSRSSVKAWLPVLRRTTGSRYLFPSRLHESPHISTRQYARLVRRRVESIDLESASGNESGRNLSAVHTSCTRLPCGIAKPEAPQSRVLLLQMIGRPETPLPRARPRYRVHHRTRCSYSPTSRNQPNRSDRKASRFGASFRFSMRLATMRLVTPAKVMPRCPWPKAWIRFG